MEFSSSYAIYEDHKSAPLVMPFLLDVLDAMPFLLVVSNT